MVTGDSERLAGRQADITGGGSGGGRTPGRRTTNRVQGGSDGGRSKNRRQGKAWSRRSPVGPRPQS